MLLYLITYDIPVNRRRKQVADLLEGYGRRVQYSVFECVLTRNQYTELQQRLQRHILFSEDSLRFYPLSRHTLGQIEIWGGAPLTTMPGSIIV